MAGLCRIFWALCTQAIVILSCTFPRLAGFKSHDFQSVSVRNWYHREIVQGVSHACDCSFHLLARVWDYVYIVLDWASGVYHQEAHLLEYPTDAEVYSQIGKYHNLGDFSLKCKSISNVYRMYARIAGLQVLQAFRGKWNSWALS